MLLKKKLKSIKKLDKLFNQLNLKKGDNVVFHSNIGGLHQFEKNLNKRDFETFLHYIINYIGKDGTLLIPTFNYDFTKGKPFNRKKSECQVGEFGNSLVKKFYKCRTYNPVFSHLIFGKLQKKIFKCNESEVFGKKSIFEIIKRENFKIISFCCSPNTITFLHYIEREAGVNYRYNKFFSGICENKKVKIKYFVGKKKFDYSIKEKKILRLIDNKNFKKVVYGRFNTYIVNSTYLYNRLKKKIDKNRYYLIKN